MATMLAIVDPGDEVVVFEPYYENYGPDAVLSGATPRFVSLRWSDATREWGYDSAELAAAFCLTCHSADYTEMQPPLPRKFWEAEVKKMQEKYFAPIPASVDAQIADYLTRAYGVPDAPATGGK